MVQTLGAPGPPRRRRRTRAASLDDPPASLPLARVTAVRAGEPFDSEAEAERWLAGIDSDEAAMDAVLETGTAMLNRALHAQAVASADPLAGEVRVADAVAARIGFGPGEALAEGRFSTARELDPRAGSGSARRQRADELRPQERIAAVLRGRQRLDVCEPLLLRARADLDAGREREAALQLRVGLEALLAELPNALAHADHERDIGTLRERRIEVGEIANMALASDLPAERSAALGELLDVCERVLRRRRVLQE